MSRIRNIKELAQIAGVSAGTVSRALADSDLVNPRTREMIQALATKHDFRLNVMARNLRNQKTGAIGVAIPLGHETGQHISDPFFISILGRIADAVTERGYDLVLSRVIPMDDHWLDKMVDAGRADGWIVIGQSNQSAALDRVGARYRPLVVWGGYQPDQLHCSVGSDNFVGGYLAAAHLIERGCKRIAFFGDPRAVEIAHRLNGCKKALNEAGLGDTLAILPAHLVAEAAHPDIAAFLSSAGERPQGIVAASDVIAMSTLRALSEFGLSVPGDVRVMGYDGLSLGEHTVPQLSTIAQNLTTGADHLVDILFKRIAGQETSSIVMTPELVVRRST